MEYFMFAQPVIFLAAAWGYCKVWGFKPKSQ